MPLDVNACFLAHRARVYRWALGLCGRHEDALDLTQEAFMRLLRDAPRSDDAAACAAWLRHTVARLAIDRWRAAAARKQREAAAGRMRQHAADGSGAGLAADAVERVRAALCGLSEKQRLVLLCKCYEDMTFAEIARELGLAEPTVKTHYVRGLAALREQLGAVAETELTP